MDHSNINDFSSVEEMGDFLEDTRRHLGEIGKQISTSFATLEKYENDWQKEKASLLQELEKVKTKLRILH